MQFLKVTDLETGRPVLINLDSIEFVTHRTEDEGGSQIRMRSAVIEVIDTPEELAALIGAVNAK